MDCKTQAIQNVIQIVVKFSAMNNYQGNILEFCFSALTFDMQPHILIPHQLDYCILMTIHIHRSIQALSNHAIPTNSIPFLHNIFQEIGM